MFLNYIKKIYKWQKQTEKYVNLVAAYNWKNSFSKGIKSDYLKLKKKHYQKQNCKTVDCVRSLVKFKVLFLLGRD